MYLQKISNTKKYSLLVWYLVVLLLTVIVIPMQREESPCLRLALSLFVSVGFTFLHCPPAGAWPGQARSSHVARPVACLVYVCFSALPYGRQCLQLNHKIIVALWQSLPPSRQRHVWFVYDEWIFLNNYFINFPKSTSWKFCNCAVNHVSWLTTIMAHS